MGNQMIDGAFAVFIVIAAVLLAVAGLSGSKRLK